MRNHQTVNKEYTHPSPDTTNKTNGVPRDEVIEVAAARRPRPGHGSGDGAGRHLAVRDLEHRPRRTLRPAGGPELAQLLAELLAGRAPVRADVIAKVLDVALQVELVLLEPADV